MCVEMHVGVEVCVGVEALSMRVWLCECVFVSVNEYRCMCVGIYMGVYV